MSPFVSTPRALPASHDVDWPEARNRKSRGRRVRWWVVEHSVIHLARDEGAARDGDAEGSAGSS